MQKEAKLCERVIYMLVDAAVDSHSSADRRCLPPRRAKCVYVRSHRWATSAGEGRCRWHELWRFYENLVRVYYIMIIITNERNTRKKGRGCHRDWNSFYY